MLNNVELQYKFILKLHIVEHSFFLCCCNKKKLIYLSVYLFRLAQRVTQIPMRCKKIVHDNVFNFMFVFMKEIESIQKLRMKLEYEIYSNCFLNKVKIEKKT